MLELDFRESGQCEIAYFGLVPELAGHGHGRWLMAQTLALAWVPGIERLWVHTCTLDHPSALNFYRAQGFVPFARAVETFDDPRLGGVLPRDAAPQIPLLA
jgi:GNAT superfamily N-acetyltransferase